jgi:nitrate/nitrite transporter NarK
LSTAFLAGTSAAAGIAAVNSVGNLAGFASPFLIGWLKDLTQSTDIGLYILTGSSLLRREGAGANRYLAVRPSGMFHWGP